MASTVEADSPVLVQHAVPPHLLSLNDDQAQISPSSDATTAALDDRIAATTTLYETADGVFPTSAMSSPEVDADPAPTQAEESTSIEHSHTAQSPPPPPDTPSVLDESNAIQITQEQGSVSGTTSLASDPMTASATDAIIVPAPPLELMELITATELHAQQHPHEIATTAEDIPEVPAEPKSDVPEWVLWQEDLSTPTEEELEAIKENDTEVDMSDATAHEKTVFPDHDDPDQRPVKKIRLSWTINGVRGTKDRPNLARVMHSPPVLIDGLYWTIKFFPRGNKCSTVSGYIQCSRRLPPPDKEVQETFLAHYESGPDGDISNKAEIRSCVRTEATPSIEDRSVSTDANTGSLHTVLDSTEVEKEAKSEDESSDDIPKVLDEQDDFRVSAQLGMVIYNPQETRTGWVQSSEHQFCPTNNDWGWSHLGGKWDEMHIRQKGQRQALLRNDKIVIDAYIRIFADPAQSLYWHSSQEEPYWPSKKLAGCFPMGTPPLYHSPAVAGMTAWLFLKPFREVLQEVDCGGWMLNSQLRPRPFIARLQNILHHMRHQKNSMFVDVEPAVLALTNYGETYTDVLTFWEAFRRAIELELEGEEEMLQRLAWIFDVARRPYVLPPLPVHSFGDVQTALNEVRPADDQLRSQGPEFLSLPLQREFFDESKREWQLRHDRLTLNEEIVLPYGNSQKYTLYGFVVHVGSRNSGHHYTIIRPNGPGGKWLAFEDGDGNKIHSLSRSMLKTYEGLVGEELKEFSSTRETAYLAMYIRKDRLLDYLPASLEEYSAPAWLQVENLSSERSKRMWEKEATKDGDSSIDVEIYHDTSTVGQCGLLDMLNVKHRDSMRSFSLPASTTFSNLRRKIAESMQIADPKSLKLFNIAYGDLGEYENARWYPCRLQKTLASWKGDSKPLCVWVSVLQTESDIEIFGDADAPQRELKNRKPARVLTEDELAALVARIDHGADDEQTTHTPESVQFLFTSGEVNEAVAEVDGATGASAVMPQTSGSSEDLSVDSDTDELFVRVPHGHLIDAVTEIEQIVGSAVEAQNIAAQQHATSPEDEAAIAALIAGDIADSSASSSDDSSSTVEPQSAENDGEHPAGVASSQSSVSGAPQEVEIKNRGPSVYGFLQKFDVQEKTFIVHGTFFASRYDGVRQIVRKHMGFDDEKGFRVWSRTSATDGMLVSDTDNFYDINFSNGVDLIVGDILGERRIAELRAASQFWEPFALSRFLRAQNRKHPLATTLPHVSIADFGQDRYDGPIVNMRRHGLSCKVQHSNGQVYEGPLVCNARQGSEGLMTYQNGDSYFGDWKDNEPDGHGSLIQKRTGNKYTGGFQQGRKWGKGTTWWQVAEDEANVCQICYGEEINALFFDCGHVCSCVECAKQCDVCPICRRTIKEVVRMYRV